MCLKLWVSMCPAFGPIWVNPFDWKDNYSATWNMKLVHWRLTGAWAVTQFWYNSQCTNNRIMVRCCAVLMCPLNGQSNWTNKNVLRSLELDSVVSTYVRLSVRHLWAVLIYQFSYSYHGRIFQWAVYITYGNNAVLLGQVAQTCCQTVSHQSRCCILRPAQRGGLFCFRYCPFGVAFVDTITRELVIFFLLTSFSLPLSARSLVRLVLDVVD